MLRWREERSRRRYYGGCVAKEDSLGLRITAFDGGFNRSTQQIG